MKKQLIFFWVVMVLMGCEQKEVGTKSQTNKTNILHSQVTNKMNANDSVYPTRKMIFNEESMTLSFFNSATKKTKVVNLKDFGYESEFKLENKSNWLDFQDLQNLQSIQDRFLSIEINSKITDNIPAKILIAPILVTKTLTKIAVAFSLEIFNSGEKHDGIHGTIIGGIGKIIIFNSDGQIEQVIHDSENSISQVEMSPNGRFLVAMRGKNFNPDVITMDVGYRFYSMKSGKILYDFNCNDSDCQGLGVKDDYGFSFHVFKYPDIIEFNIINLAEYTHLTLEFPLSQFLKLEKGALEFEKDYMILKENKDTLWFNEAKI